MATPVPAGGPAGRQRDTSHRPEGRTALASPSSVDRLPHAPLPQPAAAGERPAVRVALAPRKPASGATPFGILRPHERPLIYDVSISPTLAAAGDVVSGTVSTSSNVASVVASVAGISSGVPKVGVGQFALSYRLPSVLPPFAKGTFTIVVVARNVDGVSTSRAVAISVH